MSQSLVDNPLHIVFSTKDRYPLIKSEIENELHQYICGICRQLDSPVIIINGVEDHIHVLLQLGKNIAISKLVSEMKSNSSRWIKTKGDYYLNFSWQKGYGGFAVCRTSMEGVKKYIFTQKEHHKTTTFKEEFLSMLQRAGIAYDEKYLWD